MDSIQGVVHKNLRQLAMLGGRDDVRPGGVAVVAVAVVVHNVVVILCVRARAFSRDGRARVIEAVASLFVGRDTLTKHFFKVEPKGICTRVRGTRKFNSILSCGPCFVRNIEIVQVEEGDGHTDERTAKRHLLCVSAWRIPHNVDHRRLAADNLVLVIFGRYDRNRQHVTSVLNMLLNTKRSDRKVSIDCGIH